MTERELTQLHVTGPNADEQESPKMGLLQTPFPADEVALVAAFGKRMGWETATETTRHVMRAFTRSTELRSLLEHLPARIFAPVLVEER